MTIPADIIISGGTLMTMDEEMRVIDNALISIQGDKITGIEEASSHPFPPPAKKSYRRNWCADLARPH